MRTIWKAMALTTAVGLAVTGSISSYAAETEAAATAVSYEMKNLTSGQGADSVITGHIQITSISVKVPITSSFDIDPNKAVAVGEPATAQMGQQAQNYEITNMSTVPLDISITTVKTGAGVTLVDTVGALDSTDKSVLFAIRKTGETVPTLPGTKDNSVWMNSTDIKADSPYYVSATAANNTIMPAGTPDQKDTLSMTVYAATKKGWKSGNSFTITPTFTVSLTP